MPLDVNCLLFQPGTICARGAARGAGARRSAHVRTMNRTSHEDACREYQPRVGSAPAASSRARSGPTRKIEPAAHRARRTQLGARRDRRVGRRLRDDRCPAHAPAMVVGQRLRTSAPVDAAPSSRRTTTPRGTQRRHHAGDVLVGHVDEHDRQTGQRRCPRDTRQRRRAGRVVRGVDQELAARTEGAATRGGPATRIGSVPSRSPRSECADDRRPPLEDGDRHRRVLELMAAGERQLQRRVDAVGRRGVARRASGAPTCAATAGDPLRGLRRQAADDQRHPRLGDAGLFEGDRRRACGPGDARDRRRST